MNREEFLKATQKNFYNELTFNIEVLKEFISFIIPVFGELKVEIKGDEDKGKEIVFYDEDIADMVIMTEGVELSEEDLNMTTKVMVLSLNKEDVITIVEHGLGIFTPANKDIALFLSSLIGKKITFE